MDRVGKKWRKPRGKPNIKYEKGKGKDETQNQNIYGARKGNIHKTQNLNTNQKGKWGKNEVKTPSLR